MGVSLHARTDETPQAGGATSWEQGAPFLLFVAGAGTFLNEGVSMTGGKTLARAQQRLIRTRCRDLARVRSELLYLRFYEQLTLDVEAGRVSAIGIYSWHPPSWLEPAEIQQKT